MKKVNIEKALRHELKQSTPDVWSRINANISDNAVAPELVTVSVTANGVNTRGGAKKNIVAIGAISIFLLLAFALLMFMLFPFSKGGPVVTPQILYGDVGYVIMDINPSVQLKLDNKGKVSSVHPLNEDARVMLVGKDSELIGLDSDKALQKIFEYAYELGYISPSKKTNAVLISATLDDKDSVKLLENKMKTELDTVVKEKGLFCVVLTDAKSKSVEEDAAKYGITEQKMRLINNAISAGAVILEEEKSTISISTIYERMSEAADKLDDKLPDELQDELDELTESAEELRDGLKERVEDIISDLSDSLETDDEQLAQEVETAIKSMEDIIEELESSDDVAATLKKLYKILKDIKIHADLAVKIKIDAVIVDIKLEKIKFDLLNEKIEVAKKVIFDIREKLVIEHKTENDNHKKQDNYEDEYEDWLQDAEKAFSEDWEAMKKAWQQSPSLARHIL